MDVERDYAATPRWDGALARRSTSRTAWDTAGSPGACCARWPAAWSSTAFPVVITPDDNYNHRNHLHIRATLDSRPPLVAAAAPRGPW